MSSEMSGFQNLTFRLFKVGDVDDLQIFERQRSHLDEVVIGDEDVVQRNVAEDDTAPVQRVDRVQQLESNFVNQLRTKIIFLANVELWTKCNAKTIRNKNI
jgi:hypothetical protein